MANQKIEPRAGVDLPVRIWGMSAEGRPFSQSARARNISSDGALLTGVETELKVGEVIGLQCGDKKTRCAVNWVMSTGEIDKNQVGVKIVAAECPWQSYLPVDGTTPVTFSSSNRRRYHRHKIALPLEIRDDRAAAPFRINASDVSANGCYIESMQPLPVGTALRVDFWLDSEHIKVTAMVRTCDPGVGNGIEFTGMPPATKQRMQSHLDAIDPQMRVAAPNSK
jgi:hypothetical protein